MKITKLIVSGLATLAMTAPAMAQMGAGPVTLSTRPLGGDVYEIVGGASNQAFVVGDKGVVVFDAEMTPAIARMSLAEIAKVTSKPVNAIIISHADPDHVGGLPAYPAGIQIIAQENTKTEIQSSAADPTAAPFMAGMYHGLLSYLPTETIAGEKTMVIDGVNIVLTHVGPAHTSGDLVAYFPDKGIVLAGDVITTNTGKFPVVHYASGGSSLGWISWMKALLALNAKTYVPGHGDIETHAQLQTRLEDAEQRRAQIKALVEAGKTLADVKQAFPDPGANPMFPTFTDTTYSELTKGYPAAGPPWANLNHVDKR